MVLPNKVTVEQLTLEIVRSLGEDMVEACGAGDVDAYVNKAVRFGTDSDYRALTSRKIRERKGERIFGEEQRKRVVEEYAQFFERVVRAVGGERVGGERDGGG